MSFMSRTQRCIWSVFLTIILASGVLLQPLSAPTAHAATGDTLRQQVQSAVDSAAALIMGNNNSMDWVAVGLARAGKSIPESYLSSVAAVLNNTDNHVTAFKTKPTEFERMTLGVLAAGGDPTNIGGYNMIKQVYNADLASQGINAVIFGLIAVDAGSYDVPSDVRWTREKLIRFILDNECTNGGWNLNLDAANGDPDISGMAMTALAPYYSLRTDVKDAVDRAANYLSVLQGSTDGGYSSWGTENSESCAQVIMGLCANGMDPAGAAFTKNGKNLVDVLLSFKAADGGFKHVYSETSSNGMATEQALYALDQYLFFLDGKGSIYHWGDREPAGPRTAVVRIEGKSGVILSDRQVQVTGASGDPTVKDAVLKALQDTGTPFVESGTGFTSINEEAADPSLQEKWLCSVEDGLPVTDMTAREVHNYESIVVYLGRDAADYTYAWLEIPRSSAGLNTSVFKPHEISVYEGQEVELTVYGHVYDSIQSAYDRSPISGGAVYLDGQEYISGESAVLTDISGKAALKINTLGIHTVSVEKGDMRTARFYITVLPDALPPTVSFPESHILPRIINPGAPQTINNFWIHVNDNKDEGKDITMSATLNGAVLTPSEMRQDNGGRKFPSATFSRYYNVLAVTVTDTAGNTQTCSLIVVNLNYSDDTAPAIIVTGMTDHMAVANALLAFTVEVSDEQGGAVVPVVRLNGGDALIPADDGISYTCTLVQGENVLTVTAQDTAVPTPNIRQQSYTVYYSYDMPDNTPPVITVTGLTNNATVNSASLSFTVTAADDRDGALAPIVKLNGTAIPAGTNGRYTCTLSQGDNVITVTAADAANNTAENSYTVKYTPQVSPPGGVPFVPSAAPAVPSAGSEPKALIPSIERGDGGVNLVTAASDGTVAIKFDESLTDEIIKQMKKDEALLLNVDAGAANVSRLFVNLDGKILSEARQKGVSSLNIGSAAGSVHIPADAIPEDCKLLKVDIRKLPDTGSLTAAQKKEVGSNPVYNLQMLADDKTVGRFAKPVVVELPYDAPVGTDPETVTVFYITGGGTVENMQGIYHPDKKTVTFTTPHFSQYFVKENKVTFTDLGAFEKYRKYIESMASKGVIAGMGNGIYAPDRTLTRAEFATLLVRALKLDKTVDISKAQGFNDVKKGDWFESYVMMAAEAGLIKGVGEGNFAPDATITKQDMAVIVSRAAESHKKYKAREDSAALSFGDASGVSDYARAHVAGLVKEKVVETDESGLFNPSANVTRAEIAKILYMFFNMN